MSEELTGAAEAAVPTNDVAPATEAPQSPAEALDADLDATLAAAYDKATSEPARGEDGKFVSTKEPPAVEPDEGAPAETKAEDQTSPDAEEPEPAKPAIEPPVSWSREMRDKWTALPPEAQAYIAQRESEAHSQISRLGQQVKAFEPVAKTLEQYRTTFERNGLSYDKGLEALLAAQSMLDANPRAAILEIARTYGVDLGAQAPANDDARLVLSLQSQVAELQRQIAETRTDVNAGKAEKVAAAQAALEQEVTEFAKTAPYFKEVEDEVVAQIAAIRTRHPELTHRQLLERAYKNAVRVDETISAKIEADRKAEEAKKAREQAEKAKKVASLNVKSSSQARPASRSIDDDLAAVYDRIQSRAS